MAQWLSIEDLIDLVFDLLDPAFCLDHILASTPDQTFQFLIVHRMSRRGFLVDVSADGTIGDMPEAARKSLRPPQRDTAQWLP